MTTLLIAPRYIDSFVPFKKNPPLIRFMHVSGVGQGPSACIRFCRESQMSMRTVRHCFFFVYVLDFLPDFFDGFHISGLKLKIFCQIILQKNGVAKRS
jgi:hypothetical protein